MIYQNISYMSRNFWPAVQKVFDQGRRVRRERFDAPDTRGGATGLFTSRKRQMVAADRALPGREEALPVGAAHLVLGTNLTQRA